MKKLSKLSSKSSEIRLLPRPSLLPLAAPTARPLTPDDPDHAAELDTIPLVQIISITSKYVESSDLEGSELEDHIRQVRV